MSHALWTAGGVLGADRPSCPRAGDPPRRRCDATSRRPAVRPRQSPAVRPARPGRHDPSRVGSPASGTSRGLPRRAGSRRSGLPRRVPGAAPAAPRRRGPPDVRPGCTGSTAGRPASCDCRPGWSVWFRRASSRCDGPASGATCAPIADDWTTVDGVPVTTALRTAVDLLRWLPPHMGLAVADALARSASSRGTTSWHERRALSRLRGIGRARYLRTSSSRATESFGESWLRLRIVDAGFPRPTVQIEVRDRSGRCVYRLDLGWEDRQDGDRVRRRGATTRVRSRVRHDRRRRELLERELRLAGARCRPRRGPGAVLVVGARASASCSASSRRPHAARGEIA